MSFTNRQLLLKTRPEGLVGLDNFAKHPPPNSPTARHSFACSIFRWTPPIACG